MPNENHERYNNVDICTYTDTIDSENTFTVEQIENCVLSAGIVPYTDPRIFPLGTYTDSDCTGHNIYTPFAKASDSQILWIDDTSMVKAEPENGYWYKHIVYVSANQNENFIATDLTINKYKNFLSIETYSRVVKGQTYTLYAPSIQTKYGSENDWSQSVLAPMFLLTAGGTVAVSQKINTLMPISSWEWAWGAGTVNNSLNIIGAGLGDQRNLLDGTPITINDAIWEALDQEPYAITENTENATFPNVNVGEHFTHIYLGDNPLSLRYGYNNIDDILMECAFCGLMFEYEGKTYKPLAQNGVIYGYTDDMTELSEWDDWKHIGDHAIPTTPPTPPKPKSKDNEIDVDMAQFAPAAGFVHYIEMTYEKLVTLAASFNKYNASIWNIGGDLLKNLISLKVFACSGTHSGYVRNIHIAGHEMLDNENNPIDGNYISDLGVVDLGTIQVGSKYKFDDWRDYAPYTKIECFVPCCGWAQLPPWVMGRTVTGTLYIDMPNGSCKAVIKAGQTPVAEIGGCCAVDMPLSSVATGAKAAGVINSLANGAVSAFNPTPQNLLSGSFGILSAFNANFTETKGTMGDGSNISGCTEFLIKVTRPASTDTSNGEITTRYKHEKGIPCAKTKTLASGQGFTQIMDANIDGTMTDREKQMIIDGFKHGLIL